MLTTFRFSLKKSGTRSRESTGRARKKDSKPTIALISLIRSKNQLKEENSERILADLLQRKAEPSVVRSSVSESSIPTDPEVHNPESQNYISCEVGPPTTGTCNALSAATASNSLMSANIPPATAMATAAVPSAASGIKSSYFANSPGATSSLEDITEELARIDREIILAKKVRDVCSPLPDIEIRMTAFKC